MARSVELVAQRRRVELHLKAQSTAVKAQAVSRRGPGRPRGQTFPPFTVRNRRRFHAGGGAGARERSGSALVLQDWGAGHRVQNANKIPLGAPANGAVTQSGCGSCTQSSVPPCASDARLHLLTSGLPAQAAFEEGLRALESEARKGVSRLRATEGFLGQCLSSKAIAIRQREAEALRVRLDKELAARVAELGEKTHAAIARITDANRKFEVGQRAQYWFV